MNNKITGKENQKLKIARKVRDRKIDDLIFVEGLRLAEEALKSEINIIECFVDEKFGNTERETLFLEKIDKKSVQIYVVQNKLFDSIADTNNSQGIILIVEKSKKSFENFIHKNKHFICLHEINNPSNLGAILRTAEAAGIQGIVISKNSTDAFSPKAVRASMGASFRLAIWENADFDEVLNWAKKESLKTTAADIKAEKTYFEIDWGQPRLIIFGSEADGLSDDQLSKIEELIYIPMENEVESLNLAVSCGIICFEAKKGLK